MSVSDLIYPVDDLVSYEDTLGNDLLLTYEISLLLEVVVTAEPTKKFEIWSLLNSLRNSFIISNNDLSINALT